MGWFKRIKGGITTATHQKKETPDGLWSKCPKCKTITTTEEFKETTTVIVSINNTEIINLSLLILFI